jgi:hypothetical protein
MPLMILDGIMEAATNGDNWGGLITFVLGVVTSLTAAVVYDRLTRAEIEVVLDTGPRQQRNLPTETPCEFFHVVVRSRSARWHLLSRKPAWSCQATLEVLPTGKDAVAIGPIAARWSSQPEPLVTVGVGGQLISIPDAARMLAGRRVDVHHGQKHPIPIALKYEGDESAFLFANESYYHLSPQWANPAWRLPIGSHSIRIVVNFDGRQFVEHFWVDNHGVKRDDVRIRAAML